MAKDLRRGARIMVVTGFVMLAGGLFMIIIWFTDPDRRGVPIGVTFVGMGAAFFAISGVFARKAAAADEAARSQPPAGGDRT
jgi:hypothetical protein